MKKPFHLGALITLPLVAACGKPLGEYEVQEVTVVAANAEPDRRGVEKSDTQMLRIEFISKTDLYEASDGGGEGLYVLASFCPYNAKRMLYVSEAYYDDRSRYGPARVLDRKVLPDGRIRGKIQGNDRRPIKNPTTGEYTYTTYLALDRSATPERSGRPEQIGYDLRRQRQNLCLRVDHPGYFITPSQSEVFIIPTLMIQRALLNQPSGRVEDRP